MTMAALCLAAVSLPAAAFTVKQCNEEGNIASVIAQYRDKGASETMVTLGAKQRFSDPDIRDPVLMLIHTIYTSPAMAKLTPAQIALAVAQVCNAQEPKK